jgi:lipoate synthase
MRDQVAAEHAAVSHLVEQVAQHLVEHLRPPLRVFEKLAQQIARQQADVFGEQAENDTDQKVRRALRFQTSANPLPPPSLAAPASNV